MTGARQIETERRRQIAGEGYGEAHDDAHLPGDLVEAALAYAVYAAWQCSRDASGNPSGWTEEMALGQSLGNWWPWDATEFKPREAIDNLVRAGALIAAEIDRLERQPREEADVEDQ